MLGGLECSQFMTHSDDFVITSVEAWPVTLPLREPFVVASGSMSVAHNVFVRVTLGSGVTGFGEMAPFPNISGEDQPGCLERFSQVSRSLLGQSVWNWRRLAYQLSEAASRWPSVRCGLETALLDALCRQMGIPMWGLWGGAEVRVRETDVTLPIGRTDQVVRTAADWFAQGFRVFKMKVGKDVDADIRRIEAVYRAHSTVSFVIDANQGFQAKEALQLIETMKRLSIPVMLIEQPVHRDDLDGLAEVHRASPFPIAADESVRSLADVEKLVRDAAVDVINIKITKCGVVESVDMARLAKGSGIRLMIGGMVESRLAMGCSFGLVLGMGGVEWLDLDMPLLLAADPVQGGYRYHGPLLHPWTEPGLGITGLEDQPASIVIR